MDYRDFTVSALKTPMLWLNISTAIVGLCYWKGLAISDNHMTYFWIANVGAALNIVISLWLYFSEDKEVRTFLKSRSVRPLFTTSKQILKLLEKPKHAYTYASRSSKKYKIGLSCAAGWTVTLWALALGGPAPDAISGLAPRAMPWLGAVVGLGLCIALTVSIYRLKGLVDKKWFSLEEHPPTQSDAPNGTLKGAVLMRAPMKLTEWRGLQYQVIEISQLQGSHMPTRSDFRNKIEWTFLPIDTELG